MQNHLDSTLCMEASNAESETLPRNGHHRRSPRPAPLLALQGIADEVHERRVVQRVSIRGDAPRNHAGQQFSMSHQVRAAGAGLFE